MTRDNAELQKQVTRLYNEVCDRPKPYDDATRHAIRVLFYTLRSLAYPDRDVYPKTRRGTKGAPIVRR